jgi:tetratricopeptide (TPR) repeat protein
VTALGHAEGGSPSEAASIYRTLREPLLERALEDVELAAGEVARVAERRFQSVRDASDDRSRARALVALSDLDRHVRADYGSASLSLSGAREAAPDDVRILRALERHAMENDRTEALTELEAELARVISDVPTASVHARLAMRLALEASPDDPQAADEILTAIAARGTTHITLLRAIEGLALERTDRPLLLDVLTKRALVATTEPARVELALRIAELEEQLEGPGPSARTLKPASDALPSHPTAPEALALYLERAQDAHSAGEALEVASRAARVPGRVAALAYRAGVLWQEGARDFERALACFERALSIDVAYLDAFERAASILTRREQFARLLALYDARIDAASEPILLTKLLGQKATVAESLGDRSTARAALDRALSIEPDSPTALRRTGELALADEDYRSAADAFIRLARVRQDRDELHFIFMTLGDIYDRHTPDPRRAEASFRRVLKLVPTDKEALDRLIAVLLGQGLVEPAVEALAELVKAAPNDPRVRKHKLALAETYERVSDPRRAEQTLEELRRTHPTDLEIVTAIAELYRRENAQSALGMHLNRAAADYRKAIEERPADGQLWHGLGQAYALRGRRDATRCVAASTFALGLPDVELAKLLDANGNIPGAGKSIREQEIEELLCPRALPPAALSVFRLASEIFEKLMPFDAKAWRTEKIGGKDHPLRAEANRIAEWFGLSDVQVLVTGVAPRIFVPVSENPVTIVIDRELPAMLDEAERTFLLVRSLEIAACGMSLAVRNQPREVAFAVHGLIRAFDPMHVADGADVAQLDKFANQITKLLGRKAKSDLGPLAIEMGGRAGFDAQRLGVSAAELGDRIALLSTGSLPSGLSALLKLAGREMPSNAPAPSRVAAVRGMAESWGLVEFAASDAHFEARRLLGLDKV